MTSESLWAIGGVVLGFLLGEGSRLVRHVWRIRSLKTMLKNELRSIRAQIPQKRDILQQMRAALGRGGILSGVSVPMIDTGYRRHGPELYAHLSLAERNCLHVIYERLAVTDRMMTSFETDVRSAKAEGIVHDPFVAYDDRLQELDESLQIVLQLIDSFLEGNPTDVFAVAT